MKTRLNFLSGLLTAITFALGSVDVSHGQEDSDEPGQASGIMAFPCHEPDSATQSVEQIWNTLDTATRGALAAASVDAARVHLTMLHVIVLRLVDIACFGEESALDAHIVLQAFLHHHVGIDPASDRAAIEALTKSSNPATVHADREVLRDVLEKIENQPGQFYADSSLGLSAEQRAAEIERTREAVTNAILEWNGGNR